MSYYKRLRKDLQAASAAGVITPEQADQVWTNSYSSRTFASFKAAHWIGAAAGLFIALGVILVVASNWDKIGALAKMGAFLLLYAGIAEAALRLQEKPAAAIPLETLWFFMPALGIGLYAQIFNLSGDPVKPYLAWALLSSPLAVFSKRPLAAYLCSILLFVTLYYGTIGDGTLLTLTGPHFSPDSAGQPPWHWALALAVLAGGTALYPGRRLGLPLGASAVWLFAMLIADTDLHLKSPALITLAGMSLAVLWLTWGSEPEDDKAGLALKAWLAAVYAMTFFWHYRPEDHDYGRYYDTAAGGALAWLLLAAALVSVLFRPQRLLPGRAGDYAAKALLAASMLCAFLLFGATAESAKMLAVTANLILAGYGAASIIGGSKDSSEKQINTGVLVITLTAVTRFVDVFGGLLVSGFGFIFTGLAFAALAYFVNKGRKALIESVKK